MDPSCRGIYDLGVLFVHGIGIQTRGDTLVQFGEPIQDWLVRWIEGANLRGSVIVSDASIRQDPAEPDAPAHAQLTIQVPSRDDSVNGRRWLLAESWWAETFAVPSYAELVRWGLQILPWTVASHFAARLRRAVQRLKRSGSGTSEGFLSLGQVLFEALYFLLALAVSPLGALLVLLSLLIGLVPVPRVRSFAGWIQRRVASTVGDSFVLLGSPIQAAAIVGQVRRDLNWLGRRCRRVAIVAHSQGGAIAHEVIKAGAPRELRLLITVGSGLSKLSIIRSLMKIKQRWGIWLASCGAILVVASAPLFLHGIFAVTWQGNVAFVGYAILINAGFVIMSLSQRRTVKAVGILSIVGALSCLMFFLHQLFAQVGDIVYIFIAGFFLMIWGSKRVIDQQEPRAEDFNVLGNNRIVWHDFFASADPVPNGPLLDETNHLIKSVPIYNRSSIFTDHVTYFRNFEGFVGPAACEIARLDKADLEELMPWDRQRLEVAGYRRRWRVYWLKIARSLVLVSAVFVPLTLWRYLPPSFPDSPFWEQAHTLIAAGWQSLTKSIDVFVPSFLEPDWPSIPIQMTRAIVFLIASLMIYRVLFQIWSWWERRDLQRFFERKNFELWEIEFSVFYYLLIALMEISAFIAFGWANGIYLGLARSAMIGLFLSFLTGIRIRPLSRLLEWMTVPSKFWPNVLWRAMGITLCIAPIMVLGADGITGPVHSLDFWAIVAITTLVSLWTLWRFRRTAFIADKVVAWSCAGPTVAAWAKLRPEADPARREALLDRVRELWQQQSHTNTNQAGNNKHGMPIPESPPSVSLCDEGVDLAELLKDERDQGPVLELLEHCVQHCVRAALTLASRVESYDPERARAVLGIHAKNKNWGVRRNIKRALNRIQINPVHDLIRGTQR